MEYGNYYTEETLRSLNAAYDTLYGITSRETEKVNGIIRRMERPEDSHPYRRKETCSNTFRKTGTTSRRHISKR